MPLLAMLMPLFTNIFGGLIDRFFPDPEKAAEAKLALQTELDKAQASMEQFDAQNTASQAEVVSQEMKGPNVWLANWRGLLELSIVVIIISHWFIVPLINMFLSYFHTSFALPAFPEEAWTVLEIGLGGYVGKEAIVAHHDGNLAIAQENNSNGTNASVPVVEPIAGSVKFDEGKYFTVAKKLFPNGMTQDAVDILKQAAVAAQS